MNRRVLSFDVGTRNLAFAKLEYPRRILAMGMIDLGKHESTRAMISLRKELYERREYMEPTEEELEAGYDIVIESQPKNGVCKTVSYGILMYFKVRALPQDRLVVMMKPNEKLKCNPLLFNTMPRVTKGERKALAMKTAIGIFEDQETAAMLEFYQKHAYKQRTDLADAVVQGCRHLQRVVRAGVPSTSTHQQVDIDLADCEGDRGEPFNHRVDEVDEDPMDYGFSDNI